MTDTDSEPADAGLEFRWLDYPPAPQPSLKDLRGQVLSTLAIALFGLAAGAGLALASSVAAGGAG